jgi:F-box-like
MDNLFCALQLSEHRSNRMKLEKSTIRSAWQVREHTNLASSVYSLPTEILEQIFSVARPSSPFQRKGYAVIISHVTRRWRHVALGVACLWTDIYIWLGARDACLISYLERSSNHLLDLKIDLNTNLYRDTWLGALRPQLAIISSQIARSRSLIVDVTHKNRLHYVLVHLCRLEVQRLEALDIRFRGASYHERGMYILNGGAPVLSSLAVRGISGLSCTPPLAAVTRLHLDTTRPKLDLGQLYQVLTSMPSLKTLYLAADGVSFWQPETSWPFIRIPTLTSLTIAYPAWHYEYNSQLYKHLVTPNLESLAIEGLTAGFPAIHWDDNKQSVILDDGTLVLIPPDPKYPRLRSLAVATFDMGSDVFVNLCKTLPKVDRVSFWHQQLNTTLPLLEDFEELPLLWPDLRHITVFPITYHNIDALRDVVSSRIRSGHPLHSIGHQNDLYNDIMIPDEDIEWLREHVELVVDGYQPSE